MHADPVLAGLWKNIGLRKSSSISPLSKIYQLSFPLIFRSLMVIIIKSSVVSSLAMIDKNGKGPSRRVASKRPFFTHQSTVQNEAEKKDVKRARKTYEKGLVKLTKRGVSNCAIWNRFSAPIF